MDTWKPKSRLEISNLEISTWKCGHLEIGHLEIRHLEIRHLEIRHLEIRHLEIALNIVVICKTCILYIQHVLYCIIGYNRNINNAVY